MDYMGTQDRISLLGFLMEELRFLKKQQWSLTNYSSLIYGAIIVYHQYLKNAGSLENLGLFSIALLIAIYGTITLFDLHSTMVKQRKKMKKIIDTMPYDFELLGLKWGDEKTSFWYRLRGFLDVFCMVEWGGAGLVAWFLFRDDAQWQIYFLIFYIIWFIIFLYFLFCYARERIAIREKSK